MNDLWEKVGVSVKNSPIVSIDSMPVSVEALNDLTAQFYELSTRLWEIEERLENLRSVLLVLIGDCNEPERPLYHQNDVVIV